MNASAGSQTRTEMQNVANEARRLARAGTPLVYAQDKIDNLLVANAAIANVTAAKIMIDNSSNIIAGMGNKRIWFASMVGEGRPWDYKKVSEWRLQYDTFNGQNTTGSSSWRKGSTAFMYYDGMLISAADFGNVNYGYTGKAMGFSDTEIYSSGGFVHQLTGSGRGEGLRLDYYSTYFDSPDDYKFVRYGIAKYNFR